MRVEVTGASAAAERLRGVAARSKDSGELLTVLAGELRAMVDTAFATNTSPDGTPWAPRVEAYRFADGRPARPRYERAGRDLLESTGALHNSVSVTVQAQSVVGQAASGHAAWQQFPTRFKPARAFLPVTRGGPMTAGPAGAWFAALPARFAAFIGRGVVR